jgi:GAF domain-containing protein/HAMP domain-containing protein
MRFLKLFNTPSIRRRISFAFLIVIVFVLVMAVASYLQLRQVRPFSEIIIQNSSDLVQLQKLSTATSALDADLERYLVIRGVEYQENVSNDIQEIADAFALLQNTPAADIQSDLTTLGETIDQLQIGVQNVLDAQSADASSGEINRYVVALYSQIDLAKQLQEALLTKVLNSLQIAAQTQSQIANNVLTQFVILGIGVLFIAIFTTFTTDRRLRTISTLTSTATEIAAGDFTRIAPVESNDEIGTLAKAFNTMTAQLREFIATLEQRVADRTKALATSAEVSRRLSTILNQRELVIEVVEQVKEAFGYYHAHIYLYNDEKNELIMAGGTGDVGAAMLAEGHKVPKGRGLVGRAAESNEPVLVPDTTEDRDWLPNPLLPDTKSEVAVPISVGDQVLGVLDVQHDLTNGLGQEDVDALQSIANQVAVAIQNINQYENTQKMAADLGVVANVGIATSTITDAGHLLQEVVDLSKRSFNLYHAHIYLLNETGDVLELASGAGEVGRKMVAEGRQIPLNSEQSLVARAARTQEGVVVNDVQADRDFLPNPLLPKTRAEMAVPMLVSGNVIGVLDVQSEQVDRFTDIDVNIQTTLASQIAVALQNARSFTNAQEQAERETKLNLIAQKIQSTTTIEEAMQIAARELGHALGKRQTLVALEPSALAGDSKGVATK